MSEDLDLTELSRATDSIDEQWENARRQAVSQRQPFDGLQIDTDIDFYPEVADREPGDNNIVTAGFDIQPHVSFIAGGILIALLAWVLIQPDLANEWLTAARVWTNVTFGWFFVAMVNVYLAACLFFAFGRFGKIKIGGPTALPEFSTPAWYAMLISAGIGIGLMFFGVGEPMFHLTTPAPFWGVDPGTAEAGQKALVTTMFHWGIHGWAVYALVSLALAFFAYNRGLPLTLRSVFFPILKERIYGPWGHAIDIVTVLATLFGLATSLGLGVSQVASGLSLFGMPGPDNKIWLVLLIAGITGFATLSVVAGLDGGVKRLSQLNIYLAVAFMVFALLVGPTLFILGLMVQSVGDYLQNMVEFGTWTESLVGDEQSGWQAGWTIFYWAWWIGWSPFVGMFIARISKGRTVREIILGVLGFPTLMCFVWFSIFGGTALDLQLSGTLDVAGAVSEDMSKALFETLRALPLATLVSVIAILLIVSFFVTSSDSGSLVVDHLTSGGKLDSPKPQRVFWAVMEGAVAAVLLFSGDGIRALQAGVVTMGLPIAVVVLVMIWSMYKAFTRELDLLEDHYDAEDYLAKHQELIELSMAGRHEAEADEARAGKAAAPT